MTVNVVDAFAVTEIVSGVAVVDVTSTTVGALTKPCVTVNDVPLPEAETHC